MVIGLSVGITMTVVTPPAAADRLPDKALPVHQPRFTKVHMAVDRPGSTILPLASIVSRAGGASPGSKRRQSPS
jgi:hypothetical protein